MAYNIINNIILLLWKCVCDSSVVEEFQCFCEVGQIGRGTFLHFALNIPNGVTVLIFLQHLFHIVIIAFDA